MKFFPASAEVCRQLPICGHGYLQCDSSGLCVSVTRDVATTNHRGLILMKMPDHAFCRLLVDPFLLHTLFTLLHEFVWLHWCVWVRIFFLGHHCRATDHTKADIVSIPSTWIDDWLMQVREWWRQTGIYCQPSAGPRLRRDVLPNYPGVIAISKSGLHESP